MKHGATGDFALQRSSFRDPALPGRLQSHRWRRRLLFDRHTVQLLEITIIEKPADHVRQDLLGAGWGKLMSGR